MRILVFHDSFLPPPNYGGIERIVVTLAEEYLAKGHEVSVLCRKGSKLPAPIKVIEIPSDWNGQQVEEIIPPEIEFIHSHQPLVLEPTRPYLVTIHGNGHVGEKYHGNTNFLSRSHAGNHNSEIYVFNGVDTTRYAFQPKKEDYFIFLARTTWRVKNLKTCIQWANDLDVKLKIIGGKGVSRGNIEYVGFVDDVVKNKILGAARALIYPTNWDEPCAGAPLESLACGTPVISSANGCMPEMVSEDTGVICHNYKDLIEAVEKVKKINPSKCREKAEKYFNVTRMAEDYLALFARIQSKGKLVDRDHLPRYNFKKGSVEYIYKPTLTNRARLWAMGSI